MMVTVRSLGLTGITGYEVSVECFLSGGLPGFDVVGLPDAAVKESRERVRAAVKNCGAKFPVSRITVNLAPARVRKEGTVYDLPILLGILAAAEEISPLPQGAAFLGELSLSGALRPVTGVLPMALTAARLGIDTLYVPEANAAEATLADGLTVYGVTDVRQLIAHLKGEQVMTPAPRWTPGHQDRPLPDFADVMGQENVKRALEIAAAGGHNVLLVGSPGAGKSMLARRLPSILTDMTRAEALQTGTLFPGLNLPFKAAIQAKTPMPNTALAELMALDFAVDELGLYLTTHPTDQEVLDLYWTYVQLANEGRQKYQKLYGPLLQTDRPADGSYAWLKDPWPWERGGSE